MPNEILKLMTLYPQPVHMSSSVEYLPIGEPRRLFGRVREPEESLVERAGR